MSDTTTVAAGKRPCVPGEVPQLWTVSQVADALGISEAGVYRLLERGELAYARVTPRCLRVKREDVLALIEKRTVQARA